MFQTEERCLASFVSARQKSDQKAPNNHLFHLSAYLNRGEESPFISDLYLGGGLQELTLLIRFLSLRGHQLEERWHGLTAPFMSFILLDYAPFLAVAFADVLKVDSNRYPCMLQIRERAKAAMSRWSPSKRLSGLTGEALDQTVAEAVGHSRDLRLPPEHMPLETDILPMPKRKKKKKAKQPVPLPDVPRPEPEGLRAEALGEPGTLEAKDGTSLAAPSLCESTLESDGDVAEAEAPSAFGMSHHTWQWLTCGDVIKWAICSKKQAKDYYRLSSCSCCERVAPWSFLQDEEEEEEELPPPWRSAMALQAGPCIEGRRPGEDASSIELTGEETEDCSSEISTADVPRLPQDTSKPVEETETVSTHLAAGSSLRKVEEGLQAELQTVPTFKGVLRQLLQQLQGLQTLARQHPFWLHSTLPESFRISACSKAHAALFEEAAALAVLRRQQELRGDVFCEEALETEDAPTER